MEQHMSIICHRVDEDTGGVHTSQDRGNVWMQLRSDVIGQDWFTVFGAENQVNQDLRQRLRHERPPFRIDCPFRAESILALWTQGVALGIIPAFQAARGDYFFPKDSFEIPSFSSMT